MNPAVERDGLKLFCSAFQKMTLPWTESTAAVVARPTPFQHPFAKPQQSASKTANMGKRISKSSQ